MTASLATRAGPDAPDRDAPRKLGWPTWALIGVLLVPLVAGGVHVLVDLRGAHAVSDNALNEMIVRSLSRHVPQLGPYARDNWSHPGPLFYFLMWPLYQVLGGDSAAMAAGALTLNGIAFAVMVALARRRGGWELAVPLALAAALITVHLPHDYLLDPWNPSLTVVPFGAFLLLAWSATCGDRWALPAAAFAGSFCLETHVGYVSLVVPVLAWVVVRTWYRTRGAPDRMARCWAPLAWAAAVLVVAWALPVYQQLTGSPGNLGEVFHYFRTSPEPTHTLLDGWRLVGAQFTVTADWITGAARVTTIEPPAIQHDPVPLLLVLFLAAAVYAWRRWPALRELAVVLVVTIGFGIVGLSRTLGPMYDYRLRWIWLLAGICTAFVLAVAVRVVTGRTVATRAARRAGAALATVAGAALVVMVAIATPHLTDADPHRAEVLRTDVVTRGIVTQVRSAHGVVILRATSYGAYIAVAGAMLRLDDLGIPAQVDRHTLQARLTFGSQRVYRRGRIRALVVLASGDAIPTLAAFPGARRIAFAPGSLGIGRDDRRSAAEIRNDDLAAFVVPPGSKIGV